MARRGFTARRSTVRLKLEPFERDTLAGLLNQLESLLAPTTDARPAAQEGSVDDPFAALMGIPESASTPTDPVLRRLLPDGYRDDPEAAEEFRRFTEADLRRQKADRARNARATLVGGTDVIELDEQAASDWMLTLNDLRLALGTALGVTEDLPLDSPDPNDPGARNFVLYDWLTWLQSSCIDAMSRSGRG